MENKKGIKIKVNKKEDLILISIDPMVYPLDAIYSTAYFFLDKAYVLIYGNPKKEITVELKLKEFAYHHDTGPTIQKLKTNQVSTGYNLKKLEKEFNKELLNYSTYNSIEKKNEGMREKIIRRGLLNPSPPTINNSNQVDTEGISIVNGDDDDINMEKENDTTSTELDDTEGISIPWGEKYENKKDNNEIQKNKEKIERILDTPPDLGEVKDTDSLVKKK